ncbi:hypothetical protein [Thermococcus sp. MAR1]|uniref:hypothetical protein n=1 Tax=Thermococcus sp. MAR1 TaxID=1638263 RepID=UPI00143BDCA0|nr:hypothetical protein [Thermococcus sp. MAR1]NJE10205.1 hypothetical protein [Thermococcus sp. MAR1]
MAWELLLLYNMTWLRGYYIESGRFYIRDGIPSGWFRYYQSPEFAVLVLLPAIVSLALYLVFRDSTLLKEGLVLVPRS